MKSYHSPFSVLLWQLQVDFCSCLSLEVVSRTNWGLYTPLCILLGLCLDILDSAWTLLGLLEISFGRCFCQIFTESDWSLTRIQAESAETHGLGHRTVQVEYIYNFSLDITNIKKLHIQKSNAQSSQVLHYNFYHYTTTAFKGQLQLYFLITFHWPY